MKYLLRKYFSQVNSSNIEESNSLEKVLAREVFLDRFSKLRIN